MPSLIRGTFKHEVPTPEPKSKNIQVVESFLLFCGLLGIAFTVLINANSKVDTLYSWGAFTLSISFILFSTLVRQFHACLRYSARWWEESVVSYSIPVAITLALLVGCVTGPALCFSLNGRLFLPREFRELFQAPFSGGNSGLLNSVAFINFWVTLVMYVALLRTLRTRSQ
jgi:hypothetical protein